MAVAVVEVVNVWTFCQGQKSGHCRVVAVSGVYYIYKFIHSFLCLIYTHGFINISAKMGVEFF